MASVAATESRASQSRIAWLMRAFFFVFVGGGGFAVPYFSLFFADQGLNGLQIGLLTTLGAAISLVAAPLWGRLADHSADERRVLALGMMGYAAYATLLSFQSRFALIALVVGFGAAMGAAMFSLADSLTVRVAGGSGYGSIRLWGSLGWALLTTLSGFLVEAQGIPSSFRYYSMALSIAVLILLVAIPVPPAQLARDEQRPPLGQTLLALLRKPALIGLGLTLLLAHTSAGQLFNFTMLYLQDLGGTPRVISLAATIAAVIELPMLLLADRFLRRFRPVYALIIWVAVSMLARIAVLVSGSIETLLVARALDGVSFSFASVGIVAYVDRHSPTGFKSTLMALFGVTLYHLGNMLGAPLQGWAYDIGGGFGSNLLALGAFIVCLLILLWTARVTRIRPQTDV